MKPIHSIVVGTDLTPASRVALDEAVRIGALNGASVCAVHVIDELVAERLADILGPDKAGAQASLVEDARAAWGEFASKDDSLANVGCEVRIDDRVRGLLAAVREERADLLVLGARGAHAPNAGVGTVATAAVRHAMIPVLLVRDTYPGPYATIVACVDFSPTSQRALATAASIARHDESALHVLHVFDAPWHELHYRAPTPGLDPHFQQQYRAVLERRLRAFALECGQDVDSLDPTYAVLDHYGHRTGIVTYSEDVDADLIVLGTRGGSRIRAAILGRTAEKVLRETKCSLLAVKPAGFEDRFATGADEPESALRVKL